MGIRAQLTVLILTFLVGAAASVAVLLYAATHYAPFDSSGLIFLHPRLPNVALVRDAFAAATLLWLGGFAALTLFTLRERVRLTRSRIGAVVGLQLLIGAVFVALPIAMDSDQFAYVGYAYAGKSGDPYGKVTLAADAPQAARQAYQHWGNPLPIDRYGGLWTGANALLLEPVSHQSMQIQTTILRVVALLAACITSIIAALFLCDSLGTLMLFALNPLVFLEAANGAHNDIFLVLAGTAALALFLNRRYGLAGVLLGCATALKFAYAPFVAPLLAATYWRSRSWRTLLATAAGFCATVLLSIAPFGWRHGVVQSAFLVTREHGALAHLAPIAAIAAMIALVLLTVEAWRGRLPAVVLILIAIFMLALNGKIEAWYVLMTAPLIYAPSIACRLAFLAFSAFGIVLSQSSFGGFPLLEATFATIAIAALAFTLFSNQPVVARERSA